MGDGRYGAGASTRAPAKPAAPGPPASGGVQAPSGGTPAHAVYASLAHAASLTYTAMDSALPAPPLAGVNRQDVPSPGAGHSVHAPDAIAVSQNHVPLTRQPGAVDGKVATWRMGVPGGASSHAGSTIRAHVVLNTEDSCAHAVVAVAVVSMPPVHGGGAAAVAGVEKIRKVALPRLASQLSSTAPYPKKDRQ